MDRYFNRLTRTRVLYREVKLTGRTGKIERSADALQVGQTCTFQKYQKNPFQRRIIFSIHVSSQEE